MRERIIAKARPMLATIKRVIAERPETFSSTCLPKIKRFGSATATRKAIIPPDIKIKSTFLLLIRLEPKKEPIGIIPISMPCKKKVKPITIRREPLRKKNISEFESGAMVKCNRITKIGIGTKEKNTDFNFDLISLPPHILQRRLQCTILSSKKLGVIAFSNL